MRSLYFVGHLLILSCGFNLQAQEVHEHKMREVGHYPVPQVSLQVYRDALDGVNLHIDVNQYLLNAPNHSVSEQTDILQGHAHVFINGKKYQRLYGTDLHIPNDQLKSGVNQVAVSLNSHQHENWMANGKTIVSSVFIDLKQTPFILHTYSAQPVMLNNHTHRSH